MEILLENGSHLQAEPQLSTQSSEIPSNTMRNVQQQNISSQQMASQDKVHRLRGNSDNVGNIKLDVGNIKLDIKNDDYGNRPKLYSTDETTLKNPNIVNTNLLSQKNDPSNYSRQYVYKVDQFRHQPEPNQNNTTNQNLTNYQHITQQQPPIHIPKPQPKPLLNPNNHQ